MPPLISIIIPCHGQARFLGDAITSVLAQQYRPYEIIVIDDASPDDVAGAIAKLPVTLVRLPERRGVAHARNLGLQQCSGDYVVCLDADDRLLPAALAAGSETLSSRPRCALTWGVRHLIDATGRPLPAKPARILGSVSYEALLRGNLIGPPAGVMFRRSALAKAGGFNMGFQGAEDYEAYLRLAREHEAWGHGAPVVEYRIHAANMSGNNDRMLTAVLRVLEAQEPFVEADPRLRRALSVGQRWARESYDLTERLQRLGEHRRAGQWGKALLGTADLLRRYPRRFFPILVRRTARSVLPH